MYHSPDFQLCLPLNLSQIILYIKNWSGMIRFHFHMVGNAEPGKEYNYRPLSKLCECQLDVNDQSVDKGAGEGGAGRESWTPTESKRQTDRQTERARDEASVIVRPLSWNTELLGPGAISAYALGPVLYQGLSAKCRYSFPEAVLKHPLGFLG